MSKNLHFKSNPILDYTLMIQCHMSTFTSNKRYGGHAGTLLVHFIFWGARAEDQTWGCLTAARVVAIDT